MGGDFYERAVEVILTSFDPRPRVGGDSATADAILTALAVSIHAPAWGATRIPRCAGVWMRVSIHAPAWGATKDLKERWIARLVSIHAPAWGATPDQVRVAPDDVVSIHAPAWGATRPRSRPGVRRSVSIHAPAWGATPRLRRKRRLRNVSIHAPAWGATSWLSALPASKRRFDPRPRVGGDPVIHRRQIQLNNYTYFREHTEICTQHTDAIISIIHNVKQRQRSRCGTNLARILDTIQVRAAHPDRLGIR